MGRGSCCCCCCCVDWLCVEVGAPHDGAAVLSLGVSGAPHCEPPDDVELLPQLDDTGASLFAGCPHAPAPATAPALLPLLLVLLVGAPHPAFEPGACGLGFGWPQASVPVLTRPGDGLGDPHPDP